MSAVAPAPPSRKARASATVPGARANAAAPAQVTAVRARTTDAATEATAETPVTAAPVITESTVTTAPVTMAPTGTEASAKPVAIELAPAMPVSEVARSAEQAAKAGERDVQQNGSRCRGTVAWFSDDRGYGFIHGDDGRDIFVHHSEISSGGFRTLTDGQVVEYEVQRRAKGLNAVSVTDLPAIALRSR